MSEEYGAHIMYFDGNGKLAWQKTAKDALLEADMNDAYEALKEKYTVTLDQSTMNKINA